MSEQPSFVRVQHSFADHIKNPEVIDRPKDVDDRHMAIYRDLFFKNVMGFLNGTFPVLAEIMGEVRWAEIGRDFFSRHHNKTPYFLEISREFLSYLESEYEAQAGDPKYLYELAHYEWLELFVDVEPQELAVELDDDTDLLSAIPVLSPVAEGVVYQYPVHKISAENANPQPTPSALIVYRKVDDSIGFIESNTFTLQLFLLLKDQLSTGNDLVNTLLKQSGLEGSQAAYEGGIETLQQWHSLGLIFGSKR